MPDLPPPTHTHTNTPNASRMTNDFYNTEDKLKEAFNGIPTLHLDTSADDGIAKDVYNIQRQ